MSICMAAIVEKRTTYCVPKTGLQLLNALILSHTSAAGLDDGFCSCAQFEMKIESEAAEHARRRCQVVGARISCYLVLV